MPPSRPGPAVLIVDDEPQVATALADLLEDDYQVTIAASGGAALNVLAANQAISVILADQRMAGMTGDELFTRAKDISLATRVLVTGYADISAVIDAVNQGRIFAYVTKPWRREDLVLTVGRAAEHWALSRTVQHERALLHQLMDSSLDAIFFKDREHRFVRVNGLKARLLGAPSPGAVEGLTAAHFLPAERCAAAERAESEVLRLGTPVRDRLELAKGPDGSERWLATNLAPIRDGRGGTAGLVGITRDVTEARMLDDMKDQFIATVRHELRTPLTAIRGSLELLRTDKIGGGLGEAGRKMVDVGWRNANTLVSLISDLLDTEGFDRAGIRLRRELIDIAATVAEAVAAAPPAGPVEDRTCAVLAGVEVLADRERLLQVLAKLIANALAVTPAGGTVACRAARAGEDRVRVSVIDQGPGLAGGLRDHVFKKFTQADSSTTRRKGGAGLGLYIAKSIIEAHGGTIDFTGAEGGGTEFFIELPIHRPAAAAGRDGGLAGAAEPGQVGPEQG
jgi:PAS domain S-box-containing protein